MSSKNIILEGATYNGVESITLPTSGGGSATFNEVSDTTAIAEDVASGKFFYNALGVLTEGTASGGGGGASNYASGEFTVQNSEGIQIINIPYDGDGYPIVCDIYVKSGVMDKSDDWRTPIIYRGVGQVSILKELLHTAPTYSGITGKDQGMVFSQYKSSSSNASAIGSSNYLYAQVYRGAASNPTGSDSNNCVMFASKNEMKIFVRSTSYGFVQGLTYVYHVVYSE